MGLGREVADAYISVHGDLSPFRRDLNGAQKEIEKAAKRDAKDYAEAFGDRLEQDVHRRWNSIVDTMHSGKKVDLNRLIENFNPTDLDDAQQKMNKFLLSMSQHRKFTKEEYAEVKKGLNDAIGLMRERNKLDEENEQVQRGLSMALDANNKFLHEANAENERWARTLDGIRRNNTISNMEKDFRALAETMKSADMEDFAKGFDSLTELRSRVYEVTAAMEQQGRMSSEQAKKMRNDTNMFIRGEAEKKDALRRSAAETERLKKLQDEYNKSLSGMARNLHFDKLESDFRNLAAAMNDNDFSHFAKGTDNIKDMRRNIARTAAEMRRLGRMTDQEYLRVLQRTADLNHTFGDTDKAMNKVSKTGDRFRTIMRGIGTATRGTREHLQGFAGLNVFGDMMREGLDFIHNLDRIAVRSSRLATMFGSLGSIGGSSFAGLVTILGDVGAAFGGLAVIAPGFLIGAGIQAAVLKTALQDMKKVLHDLAPAFHKLQDSISKKFWDVAADPIREMVKDLMPTLTTQLNNTATAWGKMFARMSVSIKNIPKAYIEQMFDRMNKGIDIAGGAVDPLVRAFTTLGLAASMYFERFGSWLVKLSKDFNNFIDGAAKDGRLIGWIDNAIEGFKDMGRSFDGLFGIFNAFNSAAERAGSGGLKLFADRLQGIAKVMQSSQFQNSMTMLFSGMLIATEKIGTALKNLGPALESVMPSIKLALVDIGDVAAGIIGYIGKILSNPTVQKGITDFTGGIKKAMRILEPAIKPFADSIGNVLSLLGSVVQSVAKIATAFTVELAPVFDRMSGKVQTLLDPLSDMATRTIKALKPVAEALDTYVVGPVVAAMNSSLIPAINDFVGKAGPFLEKVVKDLGPSFKILVETTIPAILETAGELLGPIGLLFDLFTPTLADVLTKVGKGFESVSAGIRILKGEMRDTDLKTIFGKMPTPQDLQDQWGNADASSWGDVIATALTTNIQKGFEQAATKFGSWVWDQVLDFLKLFTIEGNPKMNALSAEVDKALGSWWDGVVGMITDWWNNTFGSNKDGVLGDSGAFGGGGAGGKGAGVMGKITDEMLGDTSDPKPVFQKWFEQAKKAIGAGVKNITDSIERFTGDVKKNWNDFWGGVGTKVAETWEKIRSWVADKAETIKSRITRFTEDVKTRWNEFWSGVYTKVSETWEKARSYIAGKAEEIRSRIARFAEDVKTKWTDFWNGVGDKVKNTWEFVRQWVAAKAEEIRARVARFAEDVKTNWNNFWTAVGEKVRATWEFVKQWIAAKAGEIWGNIVRFVGQVQANWNNFWTGVGEKVRATWEFMKQWIAGKVGEIVGGISGFIGRVWANWTNFWNGVGTIVSMAWNGVLGAISRGVNTAVSWIGSLPSQIWSRLQGLGNLLLGAGGAIMDGFRRGLEGAWRGVTDFVGGIAQWIRDNKGPISYDKTLLVPAGEAIMFGLETSLKDKFGNVMDFVSSMADVMSSAFAHSKMYLAGANAARGLADGLNAEKSTVANALGALQSGSLNANIGTVGAIGAIGGVGVQPPSVGKQVNIAAGAITLQSQTTSPGIAADKLLDAIIATTSF